MLRVIKKLESLLFNKLNTILIKVALILGLPFCVWSQELENLILNPSFEEHTECIPGPNNIDNVLNWFNHFDIGSPGFFSNCNNTYLGMYSVPNNSFGFQVPKSGNSYGYGYLFALNNQEQLVRNFNDILNKEPLTGTFKKPLFANTMYYFEFFVSPADKTEDFGITTDAIDIILHYDSLLLPGAQEPYINYSDVVVSNNSGNILNDTSNWMKISGCFAAKGGESYFSVGTFRPENNINYIIQNSQNNNSQAIYYFDDFLIYQCDTCCPDQYPVEDYITVNNNLITQGETATFETFLNEGHTANLYLFDSAGRIVYSAKLNGTDNSHEVPNNLAAGVYHYALVTSEKKKLGGKIVVL